VRRIRKIGNAHICEAAISAPEARGHGLDDLLRMFGGRAQTMMAHLVESGKLTREDIRETKKIDRRIGTRRSSGLGSNDRYCEPPLAIHRVHRSDCIGRVGAPPKLAASSVLAVAGQRP